MCTISGDDIENIGGPQAAASEFASFINANCKKCKQTSTVMLRGKHHYCSDCFQQNLTHKFRSAFGKSKLVRPGDTLLLAFSGGPSSLALLNLVKEGLSEDSHKKLLFKPTVVYVNECGVLDVGNAEAVEICSTVVNTARDLGFQCYVTSLEQALVSNEEEITVLEIDNSSQAFQLPFPFSNALQSELRDMLSSSKSLTAKEDLIRVLKRGLLLRTCKQLGCSYLVVGENENRLAVLLMSDVSQGRVAQAVEETAFAAMESQGVTLLRPLREFLSKEIAFYNLLSKNRPISIPTLATKTGDSSSIIQLTESFMMGLQNGFPATIDAVFRTGCKLTSSKVASRDSECVMCYAPLANAPNSSLSAEHALSFAVPSGQTSPTLNGSGNCCGLVNGLNSMSVTGCDSSKGSSCYDVTTPDVSHFVRDSVTSSLPHSDTDGVLCYGCRVTFGKLGNIPTQVLEATRRKTLDEISEFLLPNGD